MIDKILDLKDDMPLDVYNEIYNQAIKNKDARILFMLAYYVKNADILSLSEEILKTDNLRYISFFMRSIGGVDKCKFLNKILNLGSERDAYYCLFDNRDLKDEEIFKIINKCCTNQNYYFLSLYHYFITLNRFREDLFTNVKLLFTKFDINITEDNYREKLVSLKDEKLNFDNYREFEGFSNNRYLGRENYIPDMIVLHSTASFIKGLKNFYDESMEVSAHFLINTDGEIRQIVSLEDSAWANGTSLNPSSDVYYRFATNELVRSRKYNANYYTFSIEHISIDGELTDKQYQSSKEVIKRIIRYVKEKYNYDFIIDEKHIVGHKDVNAIVRAVCPGNSFPIKQIIEDLKKEI